MQYLQHVLDFFTSAALLVPIGIVGLFRWAMWLVKAIPARFYRPISNGYTTTATLVTPVYNEDPVLFRKALESWIANEPERIIAVIDVTDVACMAIAREYSRVEVLPIDIPGKRPALAAGVDATTTEIVVLVDSDVIWEPDVLAKLKMPFADPKIGGVGTRQHMYPSDGKRATIWERFADIYLDIRYSDEVPATTVVGRAVSCLSGRTAAYRTRLLQSMREAFLNETFNGRPCMSGDDKRYTCLVLQRGYRTWNQLNARVYSTFKPDFPGFVKQRIRWSRNSFRSDLRALWQGWVWKYPYLALMLIDKTVAPFTLLLGPVVLVVAMAVGNWRLVGALLLWWLLSRAAKIWAHLHRRPADWLLVPFFIGITFYMSLVKAYALLTINEHKWLTRPVAMIGGVATRVGAAGQAQPVDPYATQMLPQGRPSGWLWRMRNLFASGGAVAARGWPWRHR
ncbi:MAG: glycosyltransferase [Chloroflexales bacterium]|nr:glycosyltransferase [Chloroflexales bacterium]